MARTTGYGGQSSSGGLSGSRTGGARTSGGSGYGGTSSGGATTGGGYGNSGMSGSQSGGRSGSQSGLNQSRRQLRKLWPVRGLCEYWSVRGLMRILVRSGGGYGNSGQSGAFSGGASTGGGYGNSDGGAISGGHIPVHLALPGNEGLGQVGPVVVPGVPLAADVNSEIKKNAKD